MTKKKLFLQIQSVNIVYPNMENKIVVPITKEIEIIMSIQVCLISRMNFDYKENGGKKSFSCKSKASISCIPIWKQDCRAKKKGIGDHFEYPSLSHFTDEF